MSINEQDILISLTPEQEGQLVKERQDTESALLVMLTALHDVIADEKENGKKINWSVLMDSFYSSDQVEYAMNRVVSQSTEEEWLKNIYANANK